MSEVIPEGATDRIRSKYSVKYYKRAYAFGMNILYWWNKHTDQWEVCGYHPWDELEPIE